MSKSKEIRVTVQSVKRGKTSSMGNPSFVFSTDLGEFRTQTDAGASYAVENDFRVGQDIEVAATLHTTPAGRVYGWHLGHTKTEG